MYLCPGCYRDYCLKERQQLQPEASIKATHSLPSSSSPPAVIDPQPPVPVVVLLEVRTASPEVSAGVEQPNRCSMCRKRVGLTGIRCASVGPRFAGLTGTRRNIAAPSVSGREEERRSAEQILSS